MFYSSNKFVWIPLYLYLIFLLYRFYKQKTWWIVIAAIFVIAISDMASVHLFKNVVMRLRPCHDPQIMDKVHTVYDKCGGKFGFYSSHASNHFALAVFISHFLISKVKRVWIILLMTWAFFISYSRIYLGVHYPLDVISGALAGSLIGIMGIHGFRLLTKNRPDEDIQKP